MSEQHYLPYSEIIHSSTESWGPDSTFGHVLTYLLVILPLALDRDQVARLQEPAVPGRRRQRSRAAPPHDKPR